MGLESNSCHESNSCQKKIKLKPSWVMPLLEPSQIAEEFLNFKFSECFHWENLTKAENMEDTHRHTKSQIR